MVEVSLQTVAVHAATTLASIPPPQLAASQWQHLAPAGGLGRAAGQSWYSATPAADVGPLAAHHACPAHTSHNHRAGVAYEQCQCLPINWLEHSIA